MARLSGPLPDWFRYLPGLALGLFLARLIGEWFGVPGLWAAVLMSALLGATGSWLLARRPFNRTWPALILLVYILYPEPYFPLAVRIAAITLATFGLEWLALRAHPHAVSRRKSVSASLLLGLIFFLLYLVTLAPDVLPADSGELQVVAAQLGVAHPPGFPLYVLLAHLTTRLMPFVTPAYAVNFLSAVTSALTVSIVFMTGVTITQRYLPGLVAAVTLGTATTFWSQATTANVRSLTGLFAALILYTLIQFRTAATRGDRRAADRRLILTALLMGFGLTHHVSLLFLIVVGLSFILIVDPSLIRTPRRWVRPIAAGLLGLLPLLYLPLRATADVRGASLQLATWPGFLEHALATGFRGDLFYYLAPADLGQRLRIMGNVMAFQFEPALLVGMIIGLILLLTRDRPLTWLLGGGYAVYTLVAATYRAPQTVEYMIPAYVAASLIVAYAVGWLPEALGRFGQPGAVAASLFIALLVVSAFSQVIGHRSASGADHESANAREYAGRLLAEAPADSLILAHWHWATPLWYLQEVEGMRPDVDVRFVFPEGEPYEVTWDRRTREAFTEGRPVITTWVPTSQPMDLPVPEPIGDAVLYTHDPRITLPAGFSPTDLSIGDSIEVLGYQIMPAAGTIATGDEAVITVAWRPIDLPPPGLGLFIHLAGPDGALYGQDDRSATAAEGITLTQFRVTPRPGTPLESLPVYLGVTDGEAAERVLLTEIDITPHSETPFTRNRVERYLLDDSDATLIGYDWDHTLPDQSRLYLHWKNRDQGYFTQVTDETSTENLNLSPYRGPWGVPVSDWRFPGDHDSGHYIPLGQGIVWTGETLNGVKLSPAETTVIDQEFHSSRPINRDYVVSIRLIGLEPDDVHWAWWDLQDSIPAMGAIPTLKWVNGSFVRSSHRVKVAETAVPGQALTGALTLYDAFTNRPLPILDERITGENPWIPLCRAVVLP